MPFKTLTQWVRELGCLQFRYAILGCYRGKIGSWRIKKSARNQETIMPDLQQSTLSSFKFSSHIKKSLILLCCFFTGFYASFLETEFCKEADLEEIKIRTPRFGDNVERKHIPLSLNKKEKAELLNLLKNNDETLYKQSFENSINKLLYNLSPFTYIDHYGKLCFLINEWTKINPRSVLFELNEKGGIFKDSLLDVAYKTWSEKNPEDLALYYLENKEYLDEGNSPYILRPLMHAWGKSAPKEALKWLTSLSEKEQKTGILSIMTGVLDSSPSNMTIFIHSIPEKLLEDASITSMIMKSWAVEDPAKAIQWLNSLPIEQQKMLEEYRNLDTSYSLVKSMQEAKQAPGKLVRKIAEYPIADQKKIWEGFLLDLAESEGVVYAREWRDDFLPEEMQKELKIIYNRWYDGIESNENIQNKIKQLPKNSVTRGDLLSSFVEFYAKEDYEKSISFLKSINEPHLLGQVLVKWAYDEPEKAQNWLNTTSYIEKEKKDIINRKFEKTELFIPKE